MPSTLLDPAVVVQGLSFTWPDGRIAFRGLDAAFGAGRTGLVGSNGSGKTTLLRLVAGELRPDAGTVVATGGAALLRQDLPLRSAQTVADLLGVSARRRALAAIEHGTATTADWDVLGVASHDETLLADLGVTRRWTVAGGRSPRIVADTP